MGFRRNEDETNVSSKTFSLATYILNAQLMGRADSLAYSVGNSSLLVDVIFEDAWPVGLNSCVEISSR